MFRLASLCIISATVGALSTGCASHSHELKAAHVSTAGYKGYSCTELHAEMRANINRVDELTGILDKKADDDEGQMAIGMILFWPALFALEGGDGEEAAEYSRLKGELNAMEQVAILNECSEAIVVAQNFREQEQQFRQQMQLKRKEQESWNN